MKFQHEIYLSEKEIGDLLWRDWDHHFPLNERRKTYREMKVDSAIPDFLSFRNFHGKEHLNIYELKITANIDSVRQLCFYSRVISEQVRIKNVYSPEKLPLISLHLIAKNFDNNIFDICGALGVMLHRVIVTSKNEIQVEYHPNYDFDASIDRNFQSKLGVIYNG
jgi:hypothetical protein